MLFSERHGYKEINTLDPESLNQAIRNRFWNVIKAYFENIYKRNRAIEHLWDEFFKQDISKLSSTGEGTISGKKILLREVKDKYSDLQWHEIFGLLEFLLNRVREEPQEISQKQHSAHEILESDIVQILKEERASYKLIDRRVVPLAEEVEVEEIEKVLDDDKLYPEVKSHIRKALRAFSSQPDPDYKNSIRESITAVEALARKVIGDESATLSDLVDQLHIHPALQSGLEKLYSWTSDESGVRHSEKETKFPINEADARYMLVTCSAFVNYIIAKKND